MTEAGFLDRAGTIGRKRFARAVTDAPAARRAGRTYSHTYVSRWLSGVSPRDEVTREAIREALAARLGRIVSLDELGFRTPPAAVPPDIGLAYPGGPDADTTTVVDLLDADLAGVALLSDTPANVAAWNDASLNWLVNTRPALSDADGPRRIGQPDVDRLRAMRETFDRLDSMFGGAHARAALVHHLRTELPRVLRASATATVREAAFSAAGEMTQLAAWMSYDAGLHGLAQRYFIQALGFADVARDRLLAGSILDAMSHQANFLGRHREAANMARAARFGTDGVAVPILTAHFHAMEARALAKAGDHAACDQAMAAAVEAFGGHTPGEGPAWIGYFDPAELAAELGHCLRDLGRADQAIEQAGHALASASGDYARSDFFVAMVLADAHLDRGDLDEGCRVAAQAIEVGEGLDSVRCRGYVDEFRQRLIRYERSASARDLAERLATAKLWTSTGQP